ncbi:MAG: hypothetical protein MH825_13055 [Cyanobacteria bacterium]|nr:hypothetical protein [Cyanobacteriota bacterium]
MLSLPDQVRAKLDELGLFFDCETDDGEGVQVFDYDDLAWLHGLPEGMAEDQVALAIPECDSPGCRPVYHAPRLLELLGKLAPGAFGDDVLQAVDWVAFEEFIHDAYLEEAEDEPVAAGAIA